MYGTPCSVKVCQAKQQAWQAQEPLFKLKSQISGKVMACGSVVLFKACPASLFQHTETAGKQVLPLQTQNQDQAKDKA